MTKHNVIKKDANIIPISAKKAVNKATIDNPIAFR
jgi:hypothetical protein